MCQKDTLNPIFYEVKDQYIDVFADLKDLKRNKEKPLEYQQAVIESCPPIILDVFDQDTKLIGSSKL